MKFIKENLLQLALLQAVLATAGSLFFSEIMKLPPCILCWYQRICMYPLVIILAVGIWKKDKNIIYMVLPLSLIGTIIAIYHNLLYYKIIPESLTPCTQGISCTTKLIELFGFVTIPLLSLLAFLAIDLLILWYYRLQKSK
jgi:disulfide bond formation protein DsbB